MRHLETKSVPVPEVGLEQLLVALRGVVYPARREDLVRCAVANGAAPTLLETLRGLPARPFEGPNQVGVQVFGRHASHQHCCP